MQPAVHFQSLFNGWPKLVCLDLDGTLIDSVPSIAKAVNKALQAFNIAPAAEPLVRQWIGKGAAHLIEKAMAWAQLEHSQYLAVYAAFIDYYAKDLTQDSRLYPNVESLLKTLQQQGIPLVLITNKPSAFIEPILEHFSLLDYFSLLLGGDSLTEKKPSPLPINHALQHFKVSAGQCLMVGDSITDYHAAKAAKVKCALVSYGYHQGDLLPLKTDLLIDDLGQLLTA